MLATGSDSVAPNGVKSCALSGSNSPASYNAHISSDHDFEMSARVLTMDETLAGHAVLTGGQINIQRDAMVRRTARRRISRVLPAAVTTSSQAACAWAGPGRPSATARSTTRHRCRW